MGQFDQYINRQDVPTDVANVNEPANGNRLVDQALIDAFTGPASTFGRAAVHTALQPITAVAQFIDKPLGTNLAASTKLVDAPKPSESLSANWHAEQAGNAVGMLPWIVGLHKATSVLDSRPFLRSSLIGAAYGGLLTPNEGAGLNVLERMRGATVGAATFGALRGTHSLLGEAGLSIIDGESMLVGQSLEVFKGAVSGTVAGVVNREVGSVVAGQGLVIDRKLAESAYTFGLMGGALGTFSRVSNFGDKLSPKAEQQITETLGRPTGAKLVTAKAIFAEMPTTKPPLPTTMWKPTENPGPVKPGLIPTTEAPNPAAPVNDASINPGNSGGPMLDADGKLIGSQPAISDVSPKFIENMAELIKIAELLGQLRR